MKRLMCFFDGTWNKPDAKDETTNVVKLFRAVPEHCDHGIEQRAHYVIGIATEKALGRFTFAAGAIGIGVTERIQTGYRFLIENYAPGDEIYLFGFSRGAFQARSLAGLLTRVGLLREPDPGRIEEVWDVYQAMRTGDASIRLAALGPAMHPALRIRCIGIWDTVGSIGLPYLRRGWIRRALSLHSTALEAGVDVGLHALSIDEPRSAFRPLFWTKPKGQPLPSGQHIEQVWFPGCHANVGGGYPDSALSDISLLWMAERVAATTGAAFDIARLRRQARPDPLGEAVDPTSNGVYRLSRAVPFIRLIRQDAKGIAPWRRAVLGRWRTSWLPEGEETVNEQIHDSAFERLGFRVKVRRGDRVALQTYCPRPLRRAATCACR
jgi:uncharacterized protein (DUF2235 family)